MARWPGTDGMPPPADFVPHGSGEPTTHAAARWAAVGRGLAGPQTLATARRLRRLHIRPVNTMCRYRIRRAYLFAGSPLAAVGGVAVAVVVLWMAAEHPAVLSALWWASVAGVLALSGRVGWGIADGFILWPHRRRWVYPLGYALRPILGYGDDIPAPKFIRWARNFGEEGTAIRITLPREYVGSDDDRKLLLQAVRAIGRFAEDDINHKFILDGPFSFLQVTPREKLVIPTKVRASDIEDQLEEVRSGHPLLALGKGSNPILGDFDGDAPHVGISMRTGKGKSNQIKGIIAQEMHLGASTVFCDIKRRSQKWAKGIEGVTYCRDISAIHNAIIALYSEADQRNRDADTLGDDEEPPWQRRFLVMEEQNTTIDALQDYWRFELEGKSVSPAIRAYRALGNTGRQVNVHVVAAFQKLTALAAGGTVARDNFGLIIMSGFRPSSWKMNADELPMPNIAGKPTGRSWYVCDGEAPEGQALLWTDKFAREWASSGVSSKPVAGGVTHVSQGKRPARVAGGNILTVVAGQSERQLFTVRQASSDEGLGLVTATYQTLRGKRVTDPEFPEHDEMDGQRKLYYPETLQRWERNRERTVG